MGRCDLRSLHDFRFEAPGEVSTPHCMFSSGCGVPDRESGGEELYSSCMVVYGIIHLHIPCPLDRCVASIHRHHPDSTDRCIALSVKIANLWLA